MTVGICACCFHPRWMTLLRNSTSVSHSCWSDQLPFRGCFQPFPVTANCWKQCLSKSRGSFLSPHYLLLHYISKRQLLEGCLPLVSCSGHVSKLGGNCCFVDRKKTAWYYGLRSPHAGFWKAGRKFILEENIGNTLQETGVGKNVLNNTPKAQELTRVSIDGLCENRKHSKGKDQQSKGTPHRMEKVWQMLFRKGDNVQNLHWVWASMLLIPALGRHRQVVSVNLRPGWSK